MSEPEAAAPGRGLAIATWLGLALITLSVVWWLYYYSQYGGWGDQLGFKAPCLAVTIDDCLFMQKKLAQSAVPAYHPVLLWAGLILLAIGMFQQRTRRG